MENNLSINSRVFWKEGVSPAIWEVMLGSGKVSFLPRGWNRCKRKKMPIEKRGGVLSLGQTGATSYNLFCEEPVASILSLGVTGLIWVRLVCHVAFN